MEMFKLGKAPPPPPAFIPHNPEPVFQTDTERNNAKKLENYILHGSYALVKTEYGPILKRRAFVDFPNKVSAPYWELIKRKKAQEKQEEVVWHVVHPDASYLLSEKGGRIHQFVNDIKSLKKLKEVLEYDGSKSAYSYIFDAAKHTGVDPFALMALLASENAELKVGFNNPRQNRETHDRGLFQISDEVRMDMNKDAFLKKFISAMSSPEEKAGKSIPKKIQELARYFGIQPEKYQDTYSLAKDLMREITGKKTDKKTGKLVDDGNKINSIKHNTFSASLWFMVNLADFGNNYQLAAFAYKEGRTQTNNFLKGAVMNDPKKQITCINRGADYSWKFWSYYMIFKAYHQPASEDGFMTKTFAQKVDDVFFPKSPSFAFSSRKGEG